MWLHRFCAAIAQKAGWHVGGGHAALGLRGEQAARKYVRKLGWTVVAKNAQTRFSELDLIAVDGRTVVFVEIKTRQRADATDALMAVDHQKQRRISQAALAFLKKNRLLEHAARFDVIAITWPEPSGQPKIHHVRNAFESPLRGQFFG
jgi:putative endonuclease